MATVEEIEAATRILRGGRDWATSGPEMVPLTTGKVEAALDAAASMRAHISNKERDQCMEIVREVAEIPLESDSRPQTRHDFLNVPRGWLDEHFTPTHVRQARAIVAAAERKECT